MIRLLIFIVIFTSTGAFAQYNDSSYKKIRNELKKNCRLFELYYNDIETAEKAIKYMDKINADIQSIMLYPQSISDKFSDIETLNIKYVAKKRFRLISFLNNPGGHEITAQTFIQWIGKDSNTHIQNFNLITLDGYEVEMSQLNDSLFLYNGSIKFDDYSKFLSLLKFRNDSFIIVHNAWGHLSFNKYYPCELYEVDSLYIICKKYVEMYNSKTQLITLNEGCFGKGSCADNDCRTYRIVYYQFYEGSFHLTSILRPN